MSQSSKPPKCPNAYWTDEETEALLKHLLENRSGNEGAGEFNNTVFQSSIAAVLPFYKKGATKDIKNMKGKWQSVSTYLIINRVVADFISAQRCSYIYQRVEREIWGTLG